MRLSTLTIAFGIVLAQLPAFVANAQVDIGPGYIRAPFVRIYRDPYGGRRVQAPFVDVYSPGFRGRLVRTPTLALEDPNLTPQQRSRRKLFSAAADLSRALDRFNTGATWQKYFGLTPGGALAPDQRENDAAGISADLVSVFSHFESVAQDPQYEVIARLPAFQTTRERLQEYITQQPSRPANAPAEELPPPVPPEI